MEKTLHILRTSPSEIVERLIDAIAGDQWATVVALYEDDLSQTPVNWRRLVEDIFAHDRVICWW